MALIKPYMTEFGIEASYWKVTMITLNYDKERIEINFSLNLFVNSEAKKFLYSHNVVDLMGGQHPEKLTFFLELSDSLNIRRACYEYAKEHVDFFKDAMDDPEYIQETLGAEILPT